MITTRAIVKKENELLKQHVKQAGEGVVTITLTKDFYLILDGDIRIFLEEGKGNNQVRLKIFAPEDVQVARSNYHIKKKD